MIDMVKPAKIMMIRHAEKPVPGSGPIGVTPEGTPDEHSLTVRGWQRAGALATFFAPTSSQSAVERISQPQVIFGASGQTIARSLRSRQTVTPLANKLNTAAITCFDFGVGQEAAVATAILQSNGVVLVAWEHHNLPVIASHLPMSPNNKTVVGVWPDDRFDLVWVFDQDAAGTGYLFTQMPQLLLAGDRAI
jgi:hypothetical protein